LAKGHKRYMRGKNRLVSTVGSTPVVVCLVDLTEEALRVVLVNLLKPRSRKPRRSVEENYLPACFSLTCLRAAGNANTVDRLKGSFSQYTSVHSDAGWGNYSSSTYSLYAPVNRWLKTEHQRSYSLFLLLVVFGKALEEQALDILAFRLVSVMTMDAA